MDLITTGGILLMSIVWSLLHLGEGLQKRKGNHLRKSSRVIIAYPEIGDGAGRISNDFGSTATAPKVTREKTHNYLR
jgi:hypothetical protein